MTPPDVDRCVAVLEELRAPYACLAESNKGEPEGDTFAGFVEALDAAIRALRQGGGWLPIESAPKEAPFWIVWSAYYGRPVVVTCRCNDNTYWEGDWDYDVQATHYWPALPSPAKEG